MMTAHLPAVAKAAARVKAIMQEGLANCRAGRDHLGVLGVGSPLSIQFEDAYKTWMDVRAQAGDTFALSLGYGKRA